MKNTLINLDKTPINSPFRYAGGKFYARKIIGSYIPKHNYYVEPFVGGGSIFFYKDKVPSWINDTDKELINCYRTIKNNVDELIYALKGETATKQRHHYYKNEFKPKSKMESAVRYYYLNRTSYSGIMKQENCYFGYGDKYSMRPENWGRQLMKNNSKLKNVKITSWDFEKVINKTKSKNTFLFIDPPYFNADQNKFYTNFFTLDDHVRLSGVLKKYSNKMNFLLTYDNSPEVRELYSWAEQMDAQEWNYTISRTDDQKNKLKLKDGVSNKRKKGKEIFIFNYKVSIPEQLEIQV